MSFPYDTLDPNRQQIRLLSIHPSKSTSNAIHCSLHTVSLNDSPKFEALSYVWGTDDATEHIFLDGIEFCVKPNVAKALYQLRRTFRHRDIWVDAICINQCDIEEKNTQVPLMATLYTTADRVVVMLGDATPEIELAVAWTERYVENRFTKGALYWWRLDVARIFSDKARVNRVHAACDALHGMIQIMTRPYWFRMWTYQEYLLPKRQPLTVCGNLKFNTSTMLADPAKYSILKRIDRSIWRDNYIPADEVASLKRLWHAVRDEFIEVCNYDEVSSVRQNRMFENREAPGHHFRRTYHRKCQNPRDRIYALYGVIPDLQKAFPPDYNKSFEQMALETTIWMIDQEGPMIFTLLPFAAANAWNTQLPSWVPDYRPGSAQFISSYRGLGRISDMARRTREMESTVSDNGSEHMRTKVSDNGSILHLPAQRFGKCQAVLQFSMDPRMIASQLIRVIEMIKERWSDIDDKIQMHNQFAIIWLVFDNNSQFRNVAMWYDRLSKIAELGPSVTEEEMWESEGSTKPLIEHLRTFGGHRLFLANNNNLYLFGISPGAVEDEDIFIIPHLLNRPLILRIDDTLDSKGDKPYYKVVGQAIASITDERPVLEVLTQLPVEEFLVI
ncbi:heterokaryon incompatibility protein 6, OR allele [Aspergillus awamori]|uniref:Heterokaryon incompatibility protein 6, OR allele n=1 Tax=Aspergillus awamori TaxID=105351 RepID=A0A401KNA9_ASPAW|nr:heterokaryon incompatibility protein 6, OR allele [Aspergillus awamori]